MVALQVTRINIPFIPLGITHQSVIFKQRKCFEDCIRMTAPLFLAWPDRYTFTGRYPFQYKRTIFLRALMLKAITPSKNNIAVWPRETKLLSHECKPQQYTLIKQSRNVFSFCITRIGIILTYPNMTRYEMLMIFKPLGRVSQALCKT